MAEALKSRLINTPEVSRTLVTKNSTTQTGFYPSGFCEAAETVMVWLVSWVLSMRRKLYEEKRDLLNVGASTMICGERGDRANKVLPVSYKASIWLISVLYLS